MTAKMSGIRIILTIFTYLFLCVAFKTDHLTSSNNVGWKMRQKTITNSPTYTYLKTDKDANIKWGVRHYIPRAPKPLKYTVHKNK